MTRTADTPTPADSTMQRRSFIGAIGAVVAASNGQAQPNTPNVGAECTRGPAVWLDLDQQALDDAYTQSVYACCAAVCTTSSP